MQHRSKLTRLPNGRIKLSIKRDDGSSRFPFVEPLTNLDCWLKNSVEGWYCTFKVKKGDPLDGIFAPVGALNPTTDNYYTKGREKLFKLDSSPVKNSYSFNSADVINPFCTLVDERRDPNNKKHQKLVDFCEDFQRGNGWRKKDSDGCVSSWMVNTDRNETVHSGCVSVNEGERAWCPLKTQLYNEGGQEGVDWKYCTLPSTTPTAVVSEEAPKKEVAESNNPCWSFKLGGYTLAEICSHQNDNSEQATKKKAGK